jgi:hypothetical protein
MEDARCRKFFSEPNNPYQRRYEALRAVFVEGRSQPDVAEQFGFARSSLRQLVCEFREHCRQPEGCGSPFFASSSRDDRP